MKRLQVFLTVGSQMPFDRLTEAVAQWARQRPAVHVVAQIGASRLPHAALVPMRCVPTLDPSAYDLACRHSQLIIAHAGMGSILTALDLQRPLVILPRRGPLKETRNDHQFHTAWRVLEQQNRGARDAEAAQPHLRTGDLLPPALQSVHVALDESELPDVLDRVGVGLLAQLHPYAHRHPQPHPLPPQSMPGRSALVDHLQSLIASARAG